MEDNSFKRVVRPVSECSEYLCPSLPHLIDLRLPIVSPTFTTRTDSVFHDVEPEDRPSA